MACSPSVAERTWYPARCFIYGEELMRFRVALLIICQAMLLTVSAAVADDLPAGYSVITTTDFGKALFAEKPDATSVTAALESTLPDLAKYFDARPTIKGAYE